MKVRMTIASVIAFLAMTATSFSQTLYRGTPVQLAFDESFNSRTAREGDTVRLHVVDSVWAHGHVVIPTGTGVEATIVDIHKNGHFGKNAQIRLDIEPIAWRGTTILLQPRNKGNMVGGTRGTEAAGASGAGLVVLGPLGLGAGYFVVGKAVYVHRGDLLETQVAEDVYTR